MSGKLTRAKVTHALAQSMREFGYPDVTDEMAGEILDAYVKGPDGDFPHGVIGMFLKSQLDELKEAGADLASIASND